MKSINELVHKAVTKIKEQRTIKEFEIVAIAENLSYDDLKSLHIEVSEVTSDDLIQVRVYLDNALETSFARVFGTADLLECGFAVYKFMADAFGRFGFSHYALAEDGFGWSPATLERLDARIKELQAIQHFGAAE